MRITGDANMARRKERTKKSREPRGRGDASEDTAQPEPIDGPSLAMLREENNSCARRRRQAELAGMQHTFSVSYV